MRETRRTWRGSAVAALLAAVLFGGAIRAQAAPEVMPDGGIFDPSYYASAYPDVVEELGSDPQVLYWHYTSVGKDEGRRGLDPAMTADTSTALGEYLSVRDYYDHAVFIGDSIMAGYQYYQAKHPTGAMGGITFLAAKSYSAYHAIDPADSHHPMYQGLSRPVWEVIAGMPAVQRVFIMFGTNDLVIHDPQTALVQILQVASNIKTLRPDVEIHLISMTPMYGAAKLRGMLNNATILDLNLKLRDAAVQYNAGFVNLYTTLLVADGTLNPAYCSDSYVHLTTAAYRDVWETVFYQYALQQEGQ